MCKTSWLNALTQCLSRLPQADTRPRVAIVGMGHELRGDDAAGVEIARALSARLAGNQSGQYLVIDAGPAPENCTGAMRRFQPDLVLFVDAANLNEAPGTICWLTWQETSGLSASTHTLPPYVLANYLVSELACEVALLGIQPAHTTPDQPMSAEAEQSIEAVIQGLIETFDI